MVIRILDLYYRRPLIFDLVIITVIVALMYYIENKGYYSFSFDKTSQVIPSIGITISGFIVTMLTILLTLKSNSIIDNVGETENKFNNSFKIFLASNLYSKSISILRNGVISLLIISFITLGVSVVLKDVYEIVGIYLNIICFVFTLLVFLRSFYVLNLIFMMQESKLGK